METPSPSQKPNPNDKKSLLQVLSHSITPIINNLHNDESLEMPELALRCSQFFQSISQYCFQYYRNHVKEDQSRKTKLIKKQEKDKRESGNRVRIRKRQEEKGQESEKKLEPPKKPLTAYIIYFQDKKPHFVERYPSLNLSELTKLIAKEWKELTEQEKKVFLHRAAEDRKRYEQQMVKFKRHYGRLAGRIMEELSPQEVDIEAIINADIEVIDEQEKRDYAADGVQIEEISDEIEPQQEPEDDQAQIDQDEQGEEQPEEADSSSVQQPNQPQNEDCISVESSISHKDS